MSTEETNVAPAGADETTPIAMSVEAAAERLAGLDAPPVEEKPPAAETSSEGSSAEAEASDPASDQEAAPQDEQSEPGSADEDEEVIHGNKYVLLRDGRKVRVAELKKLVDREPEFQRQSSELQQRQSQLEAAAKQFQAEQARIAQAAQFFQQAVPLVLAKAQADIPPEVPAETWETDPLEAIRLDRARNLKISEFQTLQRQVATYQQQQAQAHQAKTAEAKAAQEQQYQARIHNELSELVKEMPELAQPEKRQAFHAKVIEGAKAIGYSEDDLATVHDRRVFKGLAMIAEHMALRSQKAVVQQKVADVPPVKAPGRRVSEAEAQAASRKDRIQRARSSGGTLDSVAAAIAALDR